MVSASASTAASSSASRRRSTASSTGATNRSSSARSAAHHPPLRVGRRCQRGRARPGHDAGAPALVVAPPPTARHGALRPERVAGLDGARRQARHDALDQLDGGWPGVAARPDDEDDDGRRMVEEDPLHHGLGRSGDVLGRRQVDAQRETEPPAGGAAQRHRDERRARDEAEQHRCGGDQIAGVGERRRWREARERTCPERGPGGRRPACASPVRLWTGGPPRPRWGQLRRRGVGPGDPVGPGGYSVLGSDRARARRRGRWLSSGCRGRPARAAG